MKHVLIAASLILIAAAAAAGEIGTVVLVKGTVTRAGAPVSPKARVSSGDTLVSSAGSFVRVKLDTQIALQTGENSELKISYDQKKDRTTLDVVRGGVLSRVQPRAVFHERLRIKTPQATMGVRGTTLYAGIASAEKTFLCVCEGTVATRYGNEERTFRTKRHESPVDISTSISSAEKVLPHDDGQIDELAKLLAN